MRKILTFIVISSAILFAVPSEKSSSQKDKKIQEQLKKQMEKEQKYAKEQTFYHGKAYDLKSFEVDPDSLPDVPSIKPDYDFDMSEGVYSD